MKHQFPNHRAPLAYCWLGIVCVALSMMCTVTTADEVSFSRDIQPILSDNCFQCHGPDEAARQADLRLDRKQDLLSAVRANEEFDPDDNELLRRITTDDPDEVMPPRRQSKR